LSKVVIAAGGTGGHVYPALATAEVLRDRGHDVVFVGGDRIEARIVPEAGFPLEVLPVRSLARELSFRAFGSAVAFARSLIGARRVLSRLRCDVVLGMGGYPAAAPCVVAGYMKIPVVLHEQNARLSLGNRMGMRHASVLALSLPLAERQPAGPQVEMTGDPLRPRLRDAAADAFGLPARRERALRDWNLDADRRTILLMGGSLGARPVNETGPRAIAACGPGVQTLHISGPEHEAAARAAWDGSSARVTVVPYVEVMEDAYAAADLAVCRSGATTVAELLAFGVPSVLIPLPHAPRAAQEANARALERAGAGRVVVQGADFSDRLGHAVREIIGDDAARQRMASEAKAMAKMDAAEHLADIVVSVVR
jgi:UDP-N-acetylglucosamine--N-acetylmuramyl-(pentapeptide) pyrophosphoryl-undecaprenol N-acetylglucosamine transferase